MSVSMPVPSVFSAFFFETYALPNRYRFCGWYRGHSTSAHAETFSWCWEFSGVKKGEKKGHVIMCNAVLRQCRKCIFGHSNCQIYRLHGCILGAFGLRTRGVTPFGIAHANRSCGTLQFVCSSLVWMGRDSRPICIHSLQCFARSGRNGTFISFF